MEERGGELYGFLDQYINPCPEPRAVGSEQKLILSIFFSSDLGHVAAGLHRCEGQVCQVPAPLCRQVGDHVA